MVWAIALIGRAHDPAAEGGEMINPANQIEFRRCQKCGQVEKVATDEIVAAGRHPDHCDNERENWVHFTAAPDAGRLPPPRSAAPLALPLLHFRGCAIIPANESKAGDDSAHTGATSSTAALPAGAAVASRRILRDNPNHLGTDGGKIDSWTMVDAQ